MHMGYFMYDTKEDLNTNNFGYVENLKIKVLESAMVNWGLSSLTLLVASGMFLF